MSRVKYTISTAEINELVNLLYANRRQAQETERVIVHKLIEGIGKTQTAVVLNIDRKTLYKKYFYKEKTKTLLV